ncbi:hypothetical protein BDZ94DRAFT_1302604 [Collybia nuda]|uniref:Uncharacterized protein n=1 Tax=Collybia nuda TaxID=64659 RepID=A0A9P6CCU5_9AGAR|nr:hypothetical protein BDZ94DRAFT_1302604 [Collybia nuda]
MAEVRPLFSGFVALGGVVYGTWPFLQPVQTLRPKLSLMPYRFTPLLRNGNTIVQVVTLDPNGLGTTQTLQTLPGSPLTPPVPSIPPTTGTSTNTAATTAAATTAATTTATEGQQGPVGQPAPTVALPSGVTPFTYTTVIDGVTTEVSDNFTPTTPPTQSPQPGPAGSIMAYSEWLSIYGPKTTGQAANSNSGLQLGSGWAICSSMVMLLGGIWVLL